MRSLMIFCSILAAGVLAAGWLMCLNAFSSLKKETSHRIREALKEFRRGLFTVAVLPCGADVIEYNGISGDPSIPSTPDNGVGDDSADRRHYSLVCLDCCPKWSRCSFINRILATGNGQLLPSDGAHKVKTRLFNNEGRACFVLDDYGKTEKPPVIEAVKYRTNKGATILLAVPPCKKTENAADDPDKIDKIAEQPFGKVNDVDIHADNSTATT